ncbi:MAG: TetR/AcrR family transcriptional regulator [Solirubrobacteraceae bacterium]
MSPSTILNPQPRPRDRSARERVLAAALTRFATASPIAVSLEDIRSEAGVSVGALYHHFPDKAAIVDALYVDLTIDVQQEFLAELREHPSAEGGIRAIVGWYLRWVTENRVAASVLLGNRPDDDPLLHDLNRRFFTEVRGWWQTHVHYGALRELPLDLIHALWLGPAQEYTRHWLSGDVERMPRTIAGVLADAAWNSLKEPT